MRQKIGVAISAMMLAMQLGSSVAALPPTAEQLEEMTALLDANDVEGLRAYLDLHPELLEGEDDFAAQLRAFMEASEDLANFLAFEGDFRSEVATRAATY